MTASIAESLDDDEKSAKCWEFAMADTAGSAFMNLVSSTVEHLFFVYGSSVEPSCLPLLSSFCDLRLSSAFNRRLRSV